MTKSCAARPSNNSSSGTSKPVNLNRLQTIRRNSRAFTSKGKSNGWRIITPWIVLAAASRSSAPSSCCHVFPAACEESLFFGFFAFITGWMSPALTDNRAPALLMVTCSRFFLMNVRKAACNGGIATAVPGCLTLLPVNHSSLFFVARELCKKTNTI